MDRLRYYRARPPLEARRRSRRIRRETCRLISLLDFVGLKNILPGQTQSRLLDLDPSPQLAEHSDHGIQSPVEHSSFKSK